MRRTAIIDGPIDVIKEEPIFTCIVPISIDNIPLFAGMEGDLGKVIANTIHTGDKVFVEGNLIREVTYGYVFMITGLWPLDHE